ncbi:MAG: hypothetical protein FJZ56_00150 [Chlamydiae bacterium]|nr:hypothetical protein [Chlamydiota bacterium]
MSEMIPTRLYSELSDFHRFYHSCPSKEMKIEVLDSFIDRTLMHLTDESIHAIIPLLNESEKRDLKNRASRKHHLDMALENKDSIAKLRYLIAELDH